MKLNLLFILFFFLGSNSVNAQGDLDDIFDDGDATPNLDILVSTDLVTAFSGAINIYGDIIFSQKYGVQVGLGVMPLGYIMDFSQAISSGGAVSGIQRNVQKGTFIDLGFKYIQTYDDSHNWYYYGSFRRWAYSTGPIDSTATIVTTALEKRIKITAGSGYSYKVFDKIGFDAHFGAYLGLYKYEAVPSTGNAPSLAILSGMDIGLGVFYNF